MKKISGYSALIVLFIFSFSSCKKEGITITKVITVELTPNQDYSYTLPKVSDADDVMQITKQADHFLKSEISESGTADMVFHYTPALDYTGSDEIKINNVEGPHQGHGMHGHCSGGHHHDDVTIYDFKITMKVNVK